MERVLMGEVIATRDLEREGPHGRTRVRVEIGRPVRSVEAGGDWACPMRVTGLTGLPGIIELSACGVDGVQALLLALELARVTLVYAKLGDGERLTFLGRPDLGLPSSLTGIA